MLLRLQSVTPHSYGKTHNILKVFLLFLLPLYSAAQVLEPDQQQLAWLGEQIFRNECNSNPACLTSWNQGEDFPSLGIGHFIWYRAGQQEIYTESFPALLVYMQGKGIVLPDWLVAANLEQPWATRAEFLAAQQDARMQDLRSFLATHTDVQVAFIVSRFNLALEHLLATIPLAERQAISSRFVAVANAHPPFGLYALIDYTHFKGEGTNPDERYQQQGWGLLQVLQGMPLSSALPLDEFVASARHILAQRVANAPPERLEQRWLDGWNKRLSTYLPALRKYRQAGVIPLNFERKNIQAMTGYASGEQPETADVIKLNTNENPYPPGPAVAAALASLHVENIRRYPPPTAIALRQSLARLHDLHPDNIIVTNGGDELLRLFLATFLDTDECVGVAAPSYSLYDVLVAAHGCKMQNFALQEDWSLPADLAAQLNAASIKLCFVVNPHAPSGKLTAAADLRKLALEFPGLLVIDEAYVDFVDPDLKHDCVPLVREMENVIILRSFSKGYSLAGLRMAYGMGAKSLIDPMQYKTKDSYNTDLIAQTLAKAAIEDQAYAKGTWKKVREQREWLRVQLSRLQLSTPPSQSNFLLAEVPPGFSAQKIYEALKARGILIRYFKLPRLDNRLRITVGTPEENQKLLTALSALMAEGAK